MNPVDLSLYGLIDPTGTGARPMPDLVREAVRGGVTLVRIATSMPEPG